MNGINRVFLMGYLGAEPEVQASKSGKSYLRLNIATHFNKKMESGERQSTTTWHKVTVWGKTAERCQNYLHKGYPLAIEGYLAKYSYSREDGTEAQSHSIVAREVHFIGSNKSSSNAPSNHEESEDFISPP